MKKKNFKLNLKKDHKMASKMKLLSRLGNAALVALTSYEVAQLTQGDTQEKIVQELIKYKPIVNAVEKKNDVDFGLISLKILVIILVIGLAIYSLKQYINKVTRSTPINLELNERQ